MHCSFNDAEVWCSEEYWHDHVITRHPELAGYEALAARCIEDPLAIYRSASHATRQIYYRPSELRSPYNRGFLGVVVEFESATGSDKRGIVLSVHRRETGPSPDEVLIWPKS